MLADYWKASFVFSTAWESTECAMGKKWTGSWSRTSEVGHRGGASN